MIRHSSGGAAQANDSVFTRDLAFVDRATIAPGFLQDCIMQQYRDVAVDFVAGSTLELLVEAVDRQGNLAACPPGPR